ncbi:MAG: beta-propeller fold lactonase family protein, partial [Candidatus Eremiobacteraeota bacterium]|nr:beta-propeller fold lactonase family protein [Candidatus Eremiobacteraeota bacterium]
MKRRLITAALACTLLAAAPARITVYSAPAGDRPAGAPNAADPYNLVLPNGRIASPAGKSVVVGMQALGVALSPDGKFAVTTNGDEREDDVTNHVDGAKGGFSLAVVDTASMRLTDVFKSDTANFWLGIVTLKDPAAPSQTLVVASDGPTNRLHLFHLDRFGKLHELPDYIALPAPTDSRFANQNKAFPGAIVLAKNKRIAYVVNNLANSVSAVDLRTRKTLHTASVGFFPYSAAVAGGRLVVSNEGLMRYGNLAQPVQVPQFTNVATNPQLASSLSIVAASGGDLTDNVSSVVMDRTPDAVTTVGGAHPTGIAVSKNGRYAYVCMTNVDRIATVDLQGTPHVVGGLELRLFDRAPYGMQPSSIVMSPDGRRLYVTLSGINAVAVLDARDPVHLHRGGLIPTGWYPSNIAISSTGRYLYVTNAKGISEEPGFQGGAPFRTGKNGRIYQAVADSNTVWSTLQRIDLHRLPLNKTTLSALGYLRSPMIAEDNSIVPPLRSLQRSSAIKHVILILEENKTFDSMLGDLKDANGQQHGNGDPSLVSFDESITPNLHALARQFSVADNFYADAEESDAGHQFTSGGVTTFYSEKTLLTKAGRTPNVNKNEDPEDYPRAGYIFNALARANMSYRDYGDLIRISGYDEGHDENAKLDDPRFVDMNDQNAPTSGLGGLYYLDVPALAALNGHIDTNYPGWNLRIRDVRRAKQFLRDYPSYVRQNGNPDFTYIWLPADHGGAGPDIPALPEEAADGDRALGMIVDYISHQP